VAVFFDNKITGSIHCRSLELLNWASL